MLAAGGRGALAALAGGMGLATRKQTDSNAGGCVDRTKLLWGVIILMLFVGIGGFLLNFFAWAAIPVVVLLALIVFFGWLKKKPAGEPGPPA